MSGKCFFDSNILVYSLSQTEPAKRVRAREVMREAVVRRTAVISYQVIQEVLNVALKPPAARWTGEQLQLYLAELTTDFEVVGWSAQLVQKALGIRERYRFRWYDCLIVTGALESGCGVLYTEDLQHGQRIEGLKVVDPFR
jgi:predicted nucleic acid-binding protein